MSIAVTSLVALAFLIPLALVVQQLARERALADAERQAAIVVAVLAVTTDPVAVERAVAATGDAAADRVAVHGLESDGPPTGVARARPEDIRLAAEQSHAVIVDVPGGLAYLEPVDIGLAPAAVVEVFIPAAELSKGVREAWYALAAVGLGLVAVSVLVGDKLAAKVVGSARGLAAAAGALGDGDLDVRVRPSGPRELAEAGTAFNTMADRVAVLLATERELIADLSHRLRTPLTVLRLEVETISEAPRVRHAVDALEAEVDDLIRTARLPAVAKAAGVAWCDAADVVRNRMSFWSAVAEDQGRACAVYGTDGAAPVPVPGTDLAAAIDALLGNVFRYTPQGTPVEVAVARRDGYVSVRIEDAGPGIPDPDWALRRGASEAGSTGLGLDIVRRVTVAGGGSLNIDRGRLGGASVVLLFADGATFAEPARTPRRRLAVRRRNSSLDLG
ncbi:MAG TPA: HAMP domain-containing sensor histidine kinase [Micromonosporaceae bacterium]|nr:HAMP domain-containing sensor histidine kinase [Micromonosporaceae bacterium]